MKTLSYSLRKIYTAAGLGLSVLAMVSCGSSRQTASNDGIYGDTRQDAAPAATASSGNGYKEYFKSLREDEVFTDVDQYTTVNDSTTSQERYATGNAGWGSETDQVIVNVYGNNWGGWGWNNWYGPGWGWGWGGWGWNSWYGGGWGWGWNSWYGPGWGWGWGGWNYPYWGGGYYQPYHYAYNQGIRGGRGDYYGGASRNSLSRYATPSRARQTAYTNAGRNSVYSNSAGRNSRSYTTPSTGRQYTPGRQVAPGRQVTPGRNSQGTTNNRGFSPVYSNSGRNNSYTPARSSSRSSSQPTYSPSRSSGGSMGGGGRSGGGGGGGRSGGGGGGRR